MPRTAHRHVSVHTVLPFGPAPGLRMASSLHSADTSQPEAHAGAGPSRRKPARGESRPAAPARARAHSPQVVAREEDDVKQREDGRDAVGKKEQPAVRPVLHVPAQRTATVP